MADRLSTLAICGAVLGGGIAVCGGGLLLWRLWSRREIRDRSYETPKYVNEYMTFHYSSPSEYIGFSFGAKEDLDYPLRCAKLCKKHKNSAISSRALDIGCGVGRYTFELSTAFDSVIGIDFSQAFINKANEMAREGSSKYRLTTEGDQYVEMEARVDSSIDRSKVQFMVGDACSLPQDIGQFGLVLASNVICRLPRPRVFLDRLKDLVVPDGIAVITSPYTWLEQYTPKKHWIAGLPGSVNGFEALKEILSPDFILVEEETLPFAIRETLREYLLTISHATVWRRKTQT